MLSYKEYKLLQESLGVYTLGLGQRHNLGITGAHTQEIEEGGMPMDFNKNNPHMEDDDDMDHDHMEDDDDMDHEDMEDMDHDEDDMDDEEDLPVDPDDEFNDENDDEDEEEEEEVEVKKKFPVGNPHDTSAFMNYSRKMKEHCGEEEDEEEDEDMDEEMPKKGDEVKFLQKKQKKFEKKMAAGDTQAKETKLGKASVKGKAAPKGDYGVSSGEPQDQKMKTGKVKSGSADKTGFEKKCSDGKMCAKCAKYAKKKMKENTGYERPEQYSVADDKAFNQSLMKMYGNPNERFSDGMRDFSEDMLIPAPVPGPGEVGYAPQTRVGSDVNAMAESIQHLMKKISQLEGKLKDK